MKTIIGKVAAIVSSSSLMINRGKVHGVENGMVFAIKIVLPPIKDPEDPTYEISGLSLEKSRVQVTSVFDRMSYAVVANPLTFKWEPFTLDATRLHQEPLIKPEDWAIKMGDVAVSIQKEVSKD